MAYTCDSKSHAARLVGSSPTSGIMNQKVVVILGPTASGKSDLAVQIAKKFNGEVISADSRQVYKGLDIGTGKITKREMKGVRHYLLDVANPKQQFSVVRFVEETRKTIAEVARRGRLPIICGGTGFYISALLGNETIPDTPPNNALRKKLKKKSVLELFALLKKLNPKRAKTMNNSDKHNPHRLTRAIELSKTSETFRNTPKTDYFKPLLIGIAPDKDELRKRIHARLLKRVRQGMINESKRLHSRGLSWKRMDELGLEYRYLALFLQKKITKDEMVEKLSTEIWRYAKRQITWFKRDKNIRWFESAKDTRIERLTRTFL